MSNQLLSSSKFVATAFLTAALYAIGALLAQECLFSHLDACALWPSAGIALAIALHRPRAAAVGTYLGSYAAVWLFFSADLPPGKATVIAAFTATGATLELLLCRWLTVKWIGLPQALEQFWSQLWFLVIAVIASGVSAAIGISVRVLMGHYTWSEGRDVLMIWCDGDAIGILLVAPLGYLLLGRLYGRKLSVDALDQPHFLANYAAIISFAVVISVCFLLLPYSLMACMFVLPVLAACFFLPRTSALALAFILSVFCTYATTRHLGPLYEAGNTVATTVNLHLFVLGLAITALTVSSALGRRVRRQYFDDLLEFSPVGIAWSTVETGEFTHANRELAEMLGYHDAKDLLNRPNAQWLYDDPANRVELLAKLRKSPKKSAHLNFVAKMKGGSKLWLKLHAKLVELAGLERILGYVENVTLDKWLARFERIISQLAHCLITSKGVDNWSQGCLTILCQELACKSVSLWYPAGSDSAHMIIQTQFHNVKHNSDVPSCAVIEPNSADCVRLWHAHHQDLPPGQIHCFELAINQRGAYGWLVIAAPDWLTVAPIPGVQETLLELVTDVVVTLMKTTLERELANAERDQILRDLSIANAELLRAQERFEAVCEFSNIGIFEADARGTTTFVNTIGRQMEGLTPDEEFDDWRKHLHPDYRREIEHNWRDYVAHCVTTPTCNEPHRMEEVFGDGSNAGRICEVTAKPIRHSDGTVTGFIGTFRDITSIHDDAVEAQLQLGIIRHDLPSALRGLRVVLHQLGEQEIAPGERMLLERAQSCCVSAEDLSVSYKERPRRDFSLRRELEGLQIGLQDSVKYEWHCDNSIPEVVKGPRREFCQVLQNLVDNSVALDEVTSLSIEVNGRSDTSGRWTLTITVEDNGPGLSEDIRKRISRPLRRLEDELLNLGVPGNGNRGRGLLHNQILLSGIGSQLIVSEGRASGLNASAYNRFTFSIEVEEAAIRTPSFAHSLNSPLQGCSVLILDDDPDARGALARVFSSQRRCKCVTVDFPDAAVSAFEQSLREGQPFTHILIDGYLRAEMTGIDVARRMRQLEGQHSAEVSKSMLVWISGSRLRMSQTDDGLFDTLISKSELIWGDGVAKLQGGAISSFAQGPSTAADRTNEEPELSGINDLKLPGDQHMLRDYLADAALLLLSSNSSCSAEVYSHWRHELVTGWRQKGYSFPEYILSDSFVFTAESPCTVSKSWLKLASHAIPQYCLLSGSR